MEADNRGVTAVGKHTRPTLELYRVGVRAAKALAPSLTTFVKQQPT